MSFPRPLIKSRHLKPGDRIAVVSPSWGGPGKFPHRYEAGVRQLEEGFGVEVVEMKHTRATPEFVAAHPEARAADLMAAFADPSIAGIIASIGGVLVILATTTVVLILLHPVSLDRLVA